MASVLPKKLKAYDREVAFMKAPKINYTKRTYGSTKLWKQACKVMPCGVTARIKYFEPYIDHCFCTCIEAVKGQ